MDVRYLQTSEAIAEVIVFPVSLAPEILSNGGVTKRDFSNRPDTALNEIPEICDRCLICLNHSHIFYLTLTMAGLEGGADASYIPEAIVGIQELYMPLLNQ